MVNVLAFSLTFNITVSSCKFSLLDTGHCSGDVTKKLEGLFFFLVSPEKRWAVQFELLLPVTSQDVTLTCT